MRISKSIGQFVSHLTAIIVGVALTFSGMSHLSAQTLVNDGIVAQIPTTITEDSFVARAVEKNR